MIAANSGAARLSTPLALIEAAENLFGRSGIDAVSLRQINALAKVSNKSAIHYHFGDKTQLVQAIWDYRLPMIEARRETLLRRTRERQLLASPHALMKVLLKPTYDVTDINGVHSYAAFFRNALRWREGASLRAASMHATPTSAKALGLLRALAPDQSQAGLYKRLRFASCTFYDMAVERDRDIADQLVVEPEDAFLAEAIEMAVGACFGAGAIIPDRPGASGLS